MRESSPPGAPTGSTGAPSRASGEIVHEQTVRAPIPVGPSETTVRVPMPTLMPPPQEQTVRAFVPSAAVGSAATALEVEELEEVDLEPEAEPASASPVIDVGALVSELEAHARGRSSEADAPVSRADQITVPEAVAKPPSAEAGRGAGKPDPRPRRKRPRDEGPALRPEPPAVSGEVSVADPEPDDLFDSSVPRRDERPRAAQARAPKVRRGDPPVVSGEVAIDPAAAQTPEVPAADVRVMSMSSSGPQPVMTASGSNPIMTAPGPQPMMSSSGSHPIMTAPGPQGMMTSSGSHPIMTPAGASPVMRSSGSHPIMTASGASPVVPRRASTDSMYVGTDVAGARPRGQADPSGPHPLLQRGRDGSHDSLVLWVLAGTLVVLAVGGVMLVISWTQ